MTARNALRALSVATCAALMVVPVFAGDNDGNGGNNGNGVCRLDGAWFGSSPAWGVSWTAVYDSDSHWTGPVSLRMVGGDPTLGGLFPATSLSSTTGTWVRTGRFVEGEVHDHLRWDGWRVHQPDNDPRWKVSFSLRDIQSRLSELTKSNLEPMFKALSNRKPGGLRSLGCAGNRGRRVPWP